MRPFFALGIAASALCIVGLIWAQVTLAQDAGLKSLRDAAIDEGAAVETVAKQQKQRFNRSYRQQPPLIPHSIQQYQIDTNANQCLGCHDWSNAGDRKAPTLSMTHYLDRDGRQLDHVAGTRWFCNQCHVPQVDAPPLVENTFVPSSNR